MVRYKTICYGFVPYRHNAKGCITMTAPTTQHPQAPSERDRWTALVVLCVGMLMIILDQTIVNVALPSIQGDLGFSQSSLAWVVNAYLIGARFVQGLGGAMTSAVILGMIVTLFPRPDEQARAIGVYAFVASAGASLGLLAGGVLTQAVNWHWIFFVNVPIGIAMAILAGRLLGRDAGIGLRQGADLPGALLIVAALMLGVYTIVEVPGHGWGSAHTLGLGAVAAALLLAFVAREARSRNP